MTPRPAVAGATDRAAGVVFWAAAALSVPIVLRANREQWFFLDDWDFLAARELRDVDDLLRPHNEHWTTLPIAIYRVVFRLVGLERYWVYALPVLAAHLAAAALLRAVIRRAGVGVWMATAAGVGFVFAGAGRANIAVAFQVTFTGALAFGLAQLVLADHDGPIGRRDFAALACGLLALMCSGIGVVMVAATGVAVLLRRGWRAAAIHTAPLASVYALWYLAYGNGSTSDAVPAAGSTADFVGWTLWNSAVGAGRGVVGGGLLAALFVVGVVVVGRAVWSDEEGRRRYGSVVGLIAAAALLVVATGWFRVALLVPGPGETPGRYIHLVVALVLPALAVGAHALVVRWRWMGWPLALVWAVLVVGNARALWPAGADRFTLGSQTQLSLLAEVAVAEGTPAHVQPDPLALEGVTAGWLVRTVDVDEGAGPVEGGEALVDRARLQLSFATLAAAPSGIAGCDRVEPGTSTPLRRGDVVAIAAAQAQVAEVREGREVASINRYAPPAGSGDQIWLRAVRDLEVRITGPQGPDVDVERCR